MIQADAYSQQKTKTKTLEQEMFLGFVALNAYSKQEQKTKI